MSDHLLTYDELAAALGRSPEAVRQLAKRKRWRRVISNGDGKARVSVPSEVLDAPRPPDDRGMTDRTSPERPPDDQPDALTVVAVLQRQIGQLEEELASTRAERDAERVRAAQVAVLEALLDAANKRVTVEERRVAEWQTVADRFALQAERLAAGAERRRWWPFRRSA